MSAACPSARHAPQERAIRLKPRVIETLNSLASAYTQRGRLADALATYREILTIDPEQATTTRAPQQQVG